MFHQVGTAIEVYKRHVLMGLVSFLKCWGGVPMIGQYVVRARIILVCLNVFFVSLWRSFLSRQQILPYAFPICCCCLDWWNANRGMFLRLFWWSVHWWIWIHFLRIRFLVLIHGLVIICGSMTLWMYPMMFGCGSWWSGWYYHGVCKLSSGFPYFGCWWMRGLRWFYRSMHLCHSVG